MVVLNCRTTESQGGLAWSLSKNNSWNCLDISSIFLHADRSNVGVLNIFRSPAAFLTFVRFLPDMIASVWFLSRNFRMILESFYQSSSSELRVNDQIFYLGGMRSTLAKRLKQTTWLASRIERSYLWIMCFDTLMARAAVSKLKLARYKKVCVFNGRMVPEYVISHSLNNVTYFEVGGAGRIYLNEVPPLSVARFTAEFPDLQLSELEEVNAEFHLATIFLTSDYEYVFAGEGFEPGYGSFQSQNEAVEVAIRCLTLRGIKVRIKAHPGVAKEQHDFVASLERRFPLLMITTEPAEDLIASSSLVVASSSSVAVEAAAVGKMVIHMMPAFYQNLGVSVYIADELALTRFLDRPVRYTSQQGNAQAILQSPVLEAPPPPTRTEVEKMLLKLKGFVWRLRAKHLS